MKNWKTCDSGQMMEKGRLLQTSNKLEWYYPGGGINCCKWKKFKVINCFMYEAKVYKRHNNPKMKSTAGVVSHCIYEKGECQLKDETFLIWEQNLLEQYEYLK